MLSGLPCRDEYHGVTGCDRLKAGKIKAFWQSEGRVYRKDGLSWYTEGKVVVFTDVAGKCIDKIQYTRAVW